MEDTVDEVIGFDFRYSLESDYQKWESDGAADKTHTRDYSIGLEAPLHGSEPRLPEPHLDDSGSPDQTARQAANPVREATIPPQVTLGRGGPGGCTKAWTRQITTFAS